MAGDCQAYVPGHIVFLEKGNMTFFMKNIAIFVQLGENVFRHHADYRKFLDVLKTQGSSEWATNVQRSYESLYVVCIVVVLFPFLFYFLTKEIKKM